MKSEEVVLSFLKRSEERETKISVFITIEGEKTLTQTRAVDQKKEKGKRFQEPCIFQLAFLLEKKVEFEKNKLDLN